MPKTRGLGSARTSMSSRDDVGNRSFTLLTSHGSRRFSAIAALDVAHGRALRSRVQAKSTVPLAKPAEDDRSRATSARKRRPIWGSQLIEGNAMKKQARDHVNRKQRESDGASATPTGAVSGDFVTETFEYDGGRQVTVRVPPDPPEAIVFAGDGQRISKWGRLLEMADVPSTMIVGVRGLTDETLRLHEYSPDFEPERFAAHEKFFVEDVRRWTESRFGVALPTERTAVFGVSAGGELALALGLRHPHVYGAVFCASPGGGYKPPGVMPSPLPRTYLVAGTQEPFFLGTQGDGRTRCAMQVRMSS